MLYTPETTRVFRQGILIKPLLIALIKVYRNFISPMMAPHCRFYPTCSCYAQQSIEQYGAWKGLYLSVIRLLKCNPWHSGGVDLVPDEFHLCSKNPLENSK